MVGGDNLYVAVNNQFLDSWRILPLKGGTNFLYIYPFESSWIFWSNAGVVGGIWSWVRPQNSVESFGGMTLGWWTSSLGVACVVFFCYFSCRFRIMYAEPYRCGKYTWKVRPRLLKSYRNDRWNTNFCTFPRLAGPATTFCVLYCFVKAVYLGY